MSLEVLVTAEPERATKIKFKLGPFTQNETWNKALKSADGPYFANDDPRDNCPYSVDYIHRQRPSRKDLVIKNLNITVC